MEHNAHWNGTKCHIRGWSFVEKMADLILWTLLVVGMTVEQSLTEDFSTSYTLPFRPNNYHLIRGQKRKKKLIVLSLKMQNCF